MKSAVLNSGNRSVLSAGITSSVYIMVIICIGFSISFPQSRMNMPVEFFREEISMTVNKDEFAISGTYYFRNNTDSDKPMPIVFPFYIDDSTHYPFEIEVSVIEGNDERPLEFRENRERGSIRFDVPMKPNGTTAWHLKYAQKIDKPQATYILQSTKAWGKPLEEAQYRIDIPDNINIDYVWADVDSVTDAGNREILWIHKTEYMPFKDMIIKWKEK